MGPSRSVASASSVDVGVDRIRRSVRDTPNRVRRSIPRSRGELRAAVRERFGIDTRALAAFRVAIGLLVIADLLLRSRNFHFYYTDDGVVPQELAELYTGDYAVSIYYYTADPTVIAALFVLQGLIAIQLIAGYKTRIAMILTFIGVISLDHHNPLVLSYADTLFRLLCFWAIFLPLGERWAVDAVHRSRRPRRTVANLATMFVLLQMVFMYVVNGVHKTQSPLWRSGEAAPLVFGIDEMTFLIGNAMREFPLALQIGGFAWFVLILFGWLLIALRGRARILYTMMLMGGHASFAVTVRIGAFAYVALAGLLLFLQEPFWRDARRIVNWLTPGSTAEDSYARGRRLGRRIATTMPRGPTIDGRFVSVRRGVYNGILVVILVTLLIVAVVVPVQAMVLLDQDLDQEERWYSAVEETRGIEYVNTAASSLGVDQPEWSVFAPHPRTTDRYYVFPAETADGEIIDVYNDGRPFSFDRHTDELQTQHSTYRERFYMNSIRRAGLGNNAPRLLADHYCETWQDEHGVELLRLEMYEVTENITSETIDAPDERDRGYDYIYGQGCGDESYHIIVTPPSDD